MSSFIDFYENKAKDFKGRLLSDMWAYSNSQFEAFHDFIQYLFPLNEKSYHSTTAPVLSTEDIKQLRSSELAKNNMLKSLNKFRDFLGIGEERNSERIKFWCHPSNHNLLRITRAIRSLRLFGLEKEAKEFYNDVSELARETKGMKVSREFWDRAIDEDIEKSMTDAFLELRKIEL